MSSQLVVTRHRTRLESVSAAVSKAVGIQLITAWGRCSYSYIRFRAALDHRAELMLISLKNVNQNPHNSTGACHWLKETQSNAKRKEVKYSNCPRFSDYVT
jgi:hypothetical protein